MNVVKLAEHGYHEALIGMALSYYREGTDLNQWIEDLNEQKLLKTGAALIKKGPDHGKWVRAINTWFIIQAPRFWWSEMDTYKVSTVSLSASTMHTLSKEPVTEAHFDPVPPTGCIGILNQLIADKAGIEELKSALPESYLQTRLWVGNYQTLRTIISQREKHRLPQWRQFVTSVREQVEHPELLEL